MKSNMIRVLSVAAIIGSITAVGCCCKKSEPDSPGVGERTGAAIDKAAEKTAEMANTAADKTAEAVTDAAEATKEVAEKVVDKTGEVLEDAGTAVEETGADLQK